jgi:hypothetical protein
LISDLSAETIKATKKGVMNFKTESKSGPPKLPYPSNLSFKIVEKLKKEIFKIKQNLKLFMTTQPALQKILKRIRHTEEEKGSHKHGNSKNNIYME